MRPVVFAVMSIAFATPASAGASAGLRDGLRYMDWPGKPAAPAARPRAERAPAPARAVPVAAPLTTPAPMAPALAAPAATPPVSATASAGRPRIYSLHREYGETPDRAELPLPLYLDALPVDLAEPPGPLLNARDARRARADDADTDPVSSTEP